MFFQFKKIESTEFFLNWKKYFLYQWKTFKNIKKGGHRAFLQVF